MTPEIQLVSGRMFNFLDPDPEVMTISVIAAALSKQCRFAGHVKRPYSVAEHCVRGSYICGDPLAFLLHDASEAFVVDVPTPLKRLLTGYAEIEDRIHVLIEETYGVSIIDNPAVHHTDKVMLGWEKRDLKQGWPDHDGIEVPDEWENLAAVSGNAYTWEIKYIDRFKELTK